MIQQKVLFGPAKGIYCRYLEGFTLNTYVELLEQISIEKKRPEPVICDMSEAQLAKIRQIIPLGELVAECAILDNVPPIRIYMVGE